MNLPSSHSIAVVTPGHTNDGANGHELQAFLSVPARLPTRVNDRVEPARAPIRYATARSLPPRRGPISAKPTARVTPTSKTGPLQSP